MLSFTLETSAAELSTGKGFHMPAPGDTGRRARRRAIQPPDMAARAPFWRVLRERFNFALKLKLIRSGRRAARASF